MPSKPTPKKPVSDEFVDPKDDSSNPPSLPPLPTYSAEENKEWSDSKEAAELLAHNSMDAKRQIARIRMFEIIENKQHISMGFSTITAYAAHLKKEHHKGTSTTTHGFSVSSLTRYRQEGKIYKKLYQAGIPFSEMPQRSDTCLSLATWLAAAIKAEYAISTADYWRAAVNLGGSAGSTYPEHIEEVFNILTNGLTPTDEAAAATAAEIKQLKDDMEKLKNEKEAVEKMMEKKMEDEKVAKKRALPEEFVKEMEADKHLIKCIKGYVAGFEFDENETTYYRHTDDEKRGIGLDIRHMIEDAFLAKITDATLDVYVKLFAPYILSQRNIALLYDVKVDGTEDLMFPDLLSEEECIKFLGNDVVVADREDD